MYPGEGAGRRGEAKVEGRGQKTAGANTSNKGRLSTQGRGTSEGISHVPSTILPHYSGGVAWGGDAVTSAGQLWVRPASPVFPAVPQTGNCPRAVVSQGSASLEDVGKEASIPWKGPGGSVLGVQDLHNRGEGRENLATEQRTGGRRLEPRPFQKPGSKSPSRRSAAPEPSPSA